MAEADELPPTPESSTATNGATETKQQTAQASKLDQLPREDLIRLMKKQLLSVKEARKQADDYKSQLKALEGKYEKLGAAAAEPASTNAQNNDDAVEMMSLELADYKNSCAELKKQLADQKSAQQAKDELVRELTERSDSVMTQKAELEGELKVARAAVARLEKEIEAQKTLINENSKETQSLSLKSQQIRAEHDLELSKLNTQLKRVREESTEQQKYVSDKTIEIRQLRSEHELLQKRYEDLKIEHSTFKERAEYVLKQKDDAKSKGTPVQASGRHEIDELLKTLKSRSEKISQLEERCSFLEDELRSTQDHSRNLKTELEDTQSSLHALRTREVEERRRNETDFEFRLRQALSEKEILQKQLNRSVEQFAVEKQQLIESFERQNGVLETRNRELNDLVSELRTTIQQQPLVAGPTPPPLTPVRDARFVQRRVQAQISKMPQPINFAHTGSAVLENSPGLDHDNEEDELRSLQDVLNDVADEYGTGRPRSVTEDASLHRSSEFFSADEFEVLEKQLAHTRELLNDMEDTNAKLLDQIKILKEEIRRLERNTEREEHTKNSEYLKNVMMKFLAPPKVNDERQQLLPILSTMLKLSPNEVAEISECIKETMVVGEEANPNSWTSYLWSNIV